MATTPENTIIDMLKRSPLFNLSLSAKELFHSNFLAWLCESYPEHTGALFADFLPRPSAQTKLSKVQRESQNFDLLLHYSDGQRLVIENKVKSIPSRAQLEGYAQKAGDAKNTGLLLLSLTDPLFFDPQQKTYVCQDSQYIWHLLSYRDLAEHLQIIQAQIAQENIYHGALLQDYIHFILALDSLIEEVGLRSNDEVSFFLPNQKRAALANIRLHDVVDKLRYAQLTHRVSEMLKEHGFVTRSENPVHMNHGEIHLSSGMTRSLGLIDLKYILLTNKAKDSPIMPGIQIQGNQFRIVLEGRKDIVHSVAQRLLEQREGRELWFDFTGVPSTDVERPLKRTFNQFSGIFLYRSKTLSDITTKKLAELIVSFAEHLRLHADEIRQHIEPTLSGW